MANVILRWKDNQEICNYNKRTECKVFKKKEFTIDKYEGCVSAFRRE